MRLLLSPLPALTTIHRSLRNQYSSLCYIPTSARESQGQLEKNIPYPPRASRAPRKRVFYRYYQTQSLSPKFDPKQRKGHLIYWAIGSIYYSTRFSLSFRVGWDSQTLPILTLSPALLKGRFRTTYCGIEYRCLIRRLNMVCLVRQKLRCAF